MLILLVGVKMINKVTSVNRYKIIQRGKDIENVRFINSNITHVRFKTYRMRNVDFVGCNLKHSNFERSVFYNSIFYNVNFSKSNFRNSKFINCHFINCKFEDVRYLNIDQLDVYKGDFNNVIISQNLIYQILQLNNVNRFREAYLLTTKRSKGTKINKGVLSLFIKEFGERDFCRVLVAVGKKRSKYIKEFISYGYLYEFSKRYLKK
ncbi:pentapeptide repeat-containing protein [Lactiplantibacillus plantarum]|jgi:hypothetical protein|uniref:pentapeptide repeat-containing protein n=3 Tax=Lactobacillales TaxID=186826 RepID=UPI0009B558E9|nr:hypothetical protein [Lactiplantibacillus plantarum]